MKKRKFLLPMFFLCLMLIYSCQKDSSGSMDNIRLAESIEVKWELISNDMADKYQFRSAFTIKNNGEGTLGNSGWSIYFNFRDIFIEGTAPETINIRFINGDFYQLSPTDKFELAPGQSITLQFDCRGRFIKESNVPAGLYFVFTDRDGNELDTAVIKNYSFHPLDPARLPQNLLPIPDPELRYKQNESINKLEVKNLTPIVPTPQEIKYTRGEVILNNKFRIHYGEGMENEAIFLANSLRKILGSELAVTENADEGPRIISLKVYRQRIYDSSEEAYHLDISNNNGIRINRKGI